jgi:hypothetical protein
VTPQAVEREALEQEIRTVGRSLADSFPSGAGGPLDALDRKAMELAEGERSCVRRCSGWST